jgi:hypothetical protein
MKAMPARSSARVKEHREMRGFFQDLIQKKFSEFTRDEA